MILSNFEYRQRNSQSQRLLSWHQSNRYYFEDCDEDCSVEPVETTDPDGVDYGWVMQTTFVLTIIIGAPVVTLLSLGTTLSTWEARAGFAIRVGAVIWILTALSVFGYARWSDTDADTDTNGTDTDAVSPPLASSRTHTKTRSDQDQDRDSHANTDTGASQTTQQSSDATRTADAEETSRGEGDSTYGNPE